MADQHDEVMPASQQLTDYLQRFRPSRALEELGSKTEFTPWPKHSQWAYYLNGSKLITWELLHELLRLAHRPKKVPLLELQRAEQLWKAAKSERERALGANARQQIELDYQRRLNASLETGLALQALIHAQNRAIDGLTIVTLRLLEKRNRTERDLHRTRGQLEQTQVAHRTELARILSELEEALDAIDVRLERTQTKQRRASEHRAVAEQLRLETVRQIVRLRAALESASAAPVSTVSVDTAAAGSDLALVADSSVSMDTVDTVLNAVEEQQQADSSLLEEARRQIAEGPDDSDDGRVPHTVPGMIVPSQETERLLDAGQREVPTGSPPPGESASVPERPSAMSSRQTTAAAAHGVASTSHAEPAQTTAAVDGDASDSAAAQPETRATAAADLSGSRASSPRPATPRMSRRRFLIAGGTIAASAAGIGLALDRQFRHEGGGSGSGGKPTSTPKAPYAWKVSVPGYFDGSRGSWDTDGYSIVLLASTEDTTPKNYLYAFDRSGDQRWRTRMPSGNQVMIRMLPSGIYCTVDGRLHSLDARGSIRWTRKLPGDAENLHGNYLAAGIDETVYTEATYGGTGLTSGDLLAYTKNGTLKWKSRFGAVDSLPLVQDTTLYVGSYDNKLYALSTSDGSVQWSVTLPGDVADPALIGSTLAVSTSKNNDLYGITTDGKWSWTAKGRGAGQYGQTLAFGNLFVTAANNRISATRTNGAKAWTFTNPVKLPSPTAPESLDPRYLSVPAIRGTTLYCVSGDSIIYALNADGERLWDIDTKEKHTSLSSHAPLIINTQVYVAGTSHLLAFDMPS